MKGCPHPPEVRAEAVRRMDAGENPMVVGHALGVARATVYQWRTDPDGTRLKARKARYKGVCIDCGGETDGTASGHARAPRRCRGCQLDKQCADRYWTEERVIAAIREWADRFGEPPSATNWNTAAMGHDPVRWKSGRYPPQSTVADRFGSWNRGIAAAGFEPRMPTNNRGPGSVSPGERERTLALYQEMGSYKAVSDLLGITPAGVRLRIKRLGEGKYMPTYSASTAIDRDIERTREHIERLRAETAEREHYLAALEQAKAALNGTNGNNAA